MTFTPKIELHLHLEGGAPPDLIRSMAAEKGLDLSDLFDANGDYAFDDFAGFLATYEMATQVFREPEDFERLTRAVLERSAAHGVIYTEMFLSPDFCGGRDLGAWRDYLAAIEAGAGQLPEIEMRGVVTAVRHLGPDAAVEAARCAAETAGTFVTGFGLAGNETVLRPHDFVRAFDMARDAGLGLTAHAGEFGGPDSVRAVIEDLKVARIGHGVRAIEDPALVDRLAAEGVVLEVNPGSNVALGVYENIATHPIETLRERGVKVTVSTDDPPFFHTDMTAEYVALTDAFAWTDATFREINRTAAEAAFCDATTRKTLFDRLEA